jgi:hypothetical protein
MIKTLSARINKIILNYKIKINVTKTKMIFVIYKKIKKGEQLQIYKKESEPDNYE